MPEPLKIEAATLDDLPVMAELLVDLFEQEADFTPDYHKQIKGLQLILEQPNRGRIFVLRLGDLIIGMINLVITISTSEGGVALILEDVIVHKDHRGQGYGSLLVRHAIDYAREKNFVRISLLTDRAEYEARTFFKRHGFTESEMVTMRQRLVE